MAVWVNAVRAIQSGLYIISMGEATAMFMVQSASQTYSKTFIDLSPNCNYCDARIGIYWNF